MALAETLTQLWPQLGDRGIYEVGCSIELKDGGVIVLEGDALVDYTEDKSKADTKRQLKDVIQAQVDKYIAEKRMNTKITNSGVIGEIESELDLTE